MGSTRRTAEWWLCSDQLLVCQALHRSDGSSHLPSAAPHVTSRSCATDGRRSGQTPVSLLPLISPHQRPGCLIFKTERAPGGRIGKASPTTHGRVCYPVRKQGHGSNYRQRHRKSPMTAETENTASSANSDQSASLLPFKEG